ncbi:MAG: hypothetical protein WD738_17740 [Pirellulales bacterium]
MVYGKYASVRQKNIEWLEWARLVHLGKLFDRHIGSLSLTTDRFNLKHAVHDASHESDSAPAGRTFFGILNHGKTPLPEDGEKQFRPYFAVIFGSS